MAVALSWFLYLLCNNRSVEERLVDEIMNVESGHTSVNENEHDDYPSEARIKAFANLLTFEKLSKMHYLQACLSETLRLYPSVPVDSKVADGPDELPDGTKLQKGDWLKYLPYAMGRMDWIWGEDVEQFNPERFLVNGVYQQESPYKFTAFQ
eukprot:c15150_g1_i2 orf=1-453(-)